MVPRREPLLLCCEVLAVRVRSHKVICVRVEFRWLGAFTSVLWGKVLLTEEYAPLYLPRNEVTYDYAESLWLTLLCDGG